MEGECEECIAWEQSIYWTHFQSLQFCQILEGDFRSQLMIPKKFCDNVRRKLQETVTLKGPSGAVTWEVELRASGDMMFLKHGWGDFVNAFSLEENDILIFKYSGHSCFDVVIFDRKSLCEKESSYFIKNCHHSESGNRDKEKRFLKNSLEEVIQEYSHVQVESTPPKKPKKDIDGRKLAASDQLINEKSQSVAHCNDIGAASRERPRNHEPSLTWETVKLPHGITKPSPQKTDPSKYAVKYVSKRRPVTEEQKEAALRMAERELNGDSFLVVMRATHVYKAFYLTIPAEWIAAINLTHKNQIVRLRTQEKTWLIRLVFGSKNRTGLCRGWREFSLGNCLEEFDVCVFKLASQKHEPLLLDVCIFRVVPEVVKPTRVPPSRKLKFSTMLSKRN